MKEEEPRCEYCGGELEWIYLPKTIYITEKPPKNEEEDIPKVRICKKCSRAYKPDIEGADIPLLEDLEREADKDWDRRGVPREGPPPP